MMQASNQAGIRAAIGAPGSDTQLLFNDAGDFGASSLLTFDGDTLAVTGANTAAPVLQVNMPASHADNAIEVLDSTATLKASINQNGQFRSTTSGTTGGFAVGSGTAGAFTLNSAVPAVSYYGQIKWSFNDSVLSSSLGYSLGGVSGSAPAGGDVHLRRYAAATLSLGIQTATAVDQTLEAHPVTGTDTAGADLTLSAGKGTGAGTGGSLKLATPVTGGSGTTLQSLSTVLQIDPDDKLGLFGATPVVQPSGTGETTGFTAGAGTGVNDDSTFTGNVGSTAYRISDIVKALKNLGLLAS